MTTNLSVRLDDETERKLNELVEHYKALAPTLREQGIALGRIGRSDIVRMAIERLYAERGGVR
jgi:predicted transcriptional regulator